LGYDLKTTLRPGALAPEINPAKINSLKLIVCCRMAADPVELVCRGRDYAEPGTVLPAGRTGD